MKFDIKYIGNKRAIYDDGSPRPMPMPKTSDEPLAETLKTCVADIVRKAGNGKKVHKWNKEEIERKREHSWYNNQLYDRRWRLFRLFVFAVRGEKCEMCGSHQELQVHHTHYNKGARAWEYTVNDVIVVCDRCHKKIHGIK